MGSRKNAATPKARNTSGQVMKSKMNRLARAIAAAIATYLRPSG